MRELRGVFPIIATPFHPDGSIDHASLRQLVRVLAHGGCDALTLFGIAGEYYKLSDDERISMAEMVIAECRSLNVPSIVSVTDHATDLAVHTARRWSEMGADALMLLPPFFLKPGAALIDVHVRAIANAVPNTPIMLQYAPEQTGVAIAPAALAQLAKDLPNVQDFKIECRPVGPYITRLLELTSGSVRCHVGNAGYNMIEAYDRGAVGVMPGCSMFDLYLQIERACVRQERERAFELHTALLSLLNQIRQDVEMIIRFEKHILMRRGVIASDTCRRPSHEPDAFEWRMFNDLFDRLVPLLGPLKTGKDVS